MATKFINKLKKIRCDIDELIEKEEKSILLQDALISQVKRPKKGPEDLFSEINFNDVSHIHTEQNYIVLHFLCDESIKREKTEEMFLISMSRALPWLQQFGFVRISKQMAVNVQIAQLHLNDEHTEGWIEFDFSEPMKVSDFCLQHVIKAYT